MFAVLTLRSYTAVVFAIGGAMRNFTENDISKVLTGFLPSAPGGVSAQQSANGTEAKDVREFDSIKAEPVELPEAEKTLLRRSLATFEFGKERPEDPDRITLLSAGRLYVPVRFSKVTFQVTYSIEIGHDIRRQRYKDDGTVENYTDTIWQVVTGQAADTAEFWIVASYESALMGYPRIAYFSSSPKPELGKKGYVYQPIDAVEYERRVQVEMRSEIYRYIMFRLHKNQKTRGLNWAGPVTLVESSLEYVMLLKVEYEVDGKRRRDAFIDERNYRNVVGKNRRGCFGVMLFAFLASGAAMSLAHFV